MTVISISIDSEHLKKLRKLAEHENRPISRQFTTVLDYYLESKKIKL